MKNEGRNWEHPALTAARAALALARRKPTEADRPPPSLFPATKASAASKAMHEARRKPTEADRPPPSLFPATKASAASKAMHERQGKVQP